VKGSKLLKPKSYNGEPDSRIFNRFVRESQAYLKAYGVPRKEQAFTLSYFLEGKAYDFYVQKVSLNEAKWSLSDFYTGLFNFSFPINYRMQMRKKLDKYYQNDKTVMEYVHGLEEFFNMIGSVTKRERVLKFWKGIRLQIQKALWRDGLNPEVSTWEEVIEQAEIIEISESVVDPREHRDKKGKPSNGHGGTSSNDRPPKPKPNNSNNSYRRTSRVPYRGSGQNRPFNRDDRCPRTGSHPSQVPYSQGNAFQKGTSRDSSKFKPRTSVELNEKEKARNKLQGSVSIAMNLDISNGIVHEGVL